MTTVNVTLEDKTIEVRNPRFNEDGTIECDLNHARLGWIPFTASKSDVEETGVAIFDACEEIATPFELTDEVVALKLQIERNQMECTPLQGKLALGETHWNTIEAFMGSPEIPWAMKQTILSASVWKRNSQDIAALQWITNLTDEEVDDLFRLAMTIE